MRIDAVISTAVVILALLIIPLYYVYCIVSHPGVYPMEMSDESAHTFVEIPMAHKALLDGHILKMNLFNNFGSPLIGDPISCPYALHSVTYLFFKPHIAMLASKILLAFLSVLVLFLFYRRRKLSGFSAMLTALLTYTAPIFFFFHHNHPHQGILFYFPLILLFTDLTVAHPDKRRHYFLLFISFALFFLGVGINGILFGLPFIFIYALVQSQYRIRLFSKIFLLPLLSALILTHSHLFYFLKISGLTWRSGYDMAAALGITFKDIMDSLTFPPERLTLPYSQLTFNYSIPVIILSALGTIRFFNKRKTPDLTIFLILGLVPFLGVLGFMSYSWLQSALPVLRPVAIPRLYWFSTVFFMIPLGLLIDDLKDRKVSAAFVGYSTIISSVLLGLFVLVMKFEMPYVRLLLYIFSPVILLAAYYFHFSKRNWNRLIYYLFCGALLFVLTLPRFGTFKQIVNNWYYVELLYYFMPPHFIEEMEPYYRLSSEMNPHIGADQKIGSHSIFGSAGRSIIMNGGLKSHLQKNDLIADYGMAYTISPGTPEKLAKYGIRYFSAVGTSSPLVLENLGWRWIGPQVISTDFKYITLYENPLRPSPVYFLCDGQMNFIYDYKIAYDRIDLEMPDTACKGAEVVATFVDWPGWKATIDGKPADIFKKDDQFIRLNWNGGKKVVLVFEPYSGRYMAGCAILWMVFVAGAVMVSAGTKTHAK